MAGASRTCKFVKLKLRSVDGVDLLGLFYAFSQQASSCVRSIAVRSATFRRNLLLQLLNPYHIISAIIVLQAGAQLEVAFCEVCPNSKVVRGRRMLSPPARVAAPSLRWVMCFALIHERLVGIQGEERETSDLEWRDSRYQVTLFFYVNPLDGQSTAFYWYFSLSSLAYYTLRRLLTCLGVIRALTLMFYITRTFL